MSTKAIIVISSFSSQEEATQIINLALKENLIACAQMQSPIQSFYTWEGKQCHEQEHIVLFKTLSHLENALYTLIKQHHSYDCPEIISQSLSNIDPSYQQWMETVCQNQA